MTPVEPPETESVNDGTDGLPDPDEYPEWTQVRNRTLTALEREGPNGRKRSEVTRWKSGDRTVSVTLMSHPDNPYDDPSPRILGELFDPIRTGGR